MMTNDQNDKKPWTAPVLKVCRVCEPQLPSDSARDDDSAREDDEASEEDP